MKPNPAKILVNVKPEAKTSLSQPSPPSPSQRSLSQADSQPARDAGWAVAGQWPLATGEHLGGVLGLGAQARGP